MGSADMHGTEDAVLWLGTEQKTTGPMVILAFLANHVQREHTQGRFI